MLRKLLLFPLAFLLMGAAVSHAQTGELEGMVTDARSGEPVPTANVFLLKLNRGATTNLDGEFTVSNIPVGTYTVRITFVGYDTFRREVTIEANQTTEIEAELETGAQELDDVVVTGYTSTSRRNLTGSVSTVNSDDFNKVPVGNFEQAIKGKLPGVFISSGSGQPGSQSTVRIRGSASINGNNEPLYVIDGVQVGQDEFASLNTDDIADVSILKDASATAEYGSRGSNGVVVITTKTGRPGDVEVSYSSQFGVSSSGSPPFDMMNTRQKLQFEEIIQSGPGWTTSPNNPNATQADLARRQELLAVDRDWADTFFRTGFTQEHQLSISGGNEDATYRVSGSAFEQEGSVIRSRLQRFTLRLNTDIRANDFFKYGLRGTIGFNESSFIESEGAVALANPLAAAFLENPYTRLRDDNGDIDVGGGQTGPNAFDRLDKDSDASDEFKGVGKVFGTFTIKGFELTQEISIDWTELTETDVTRPNSFAGQNEPNGGAGSLFRNQDRETIITFNTNLRYEYQINDDNTLNFYAANELIRDKSDEFGFTGFGLSPKLGNTPNNITPGSPTNNQIPTTSGFKTRNNLWSVISIIDYNYADKYSLKGTMRRDGSSRFGEGNQFAWLWSIGGNWNITQENFMDDVDMIDNLSLRASYGKTGNQLGIGNFESIPTFATNDFAGEQTLIPASPGNPDLKWETTYKTNFGIDVTAFDGKLRGTLDIYNERTEDLFVAQQLSRTTGFNSLDINAGEMRNRGIEFKVSGDVVQTNDLLVTLNVNYAYNKNEILDLGQVDEFEQGTSIIREGLELGSHFVVPRVGVDPATGAPLWRDLDGNITTEFSDNFAQADFGTWLPPITGGFGVDVSWKNFRFTSQFNYVFGNVLFNNNRFFLENPNFAQFNQRVDMLDIWQQPGDVTAVQSQQFQRQFSTRDLENGSYIRLKNARISYRLPQKFLSNQDYIKSASVFFIGENLATWTSFTGFDPENFNNIEQFSFPIPRIFTGGFDINF